MCGICGVVQVSGEPRLPVDQDVLDRMTDVMTHRGPDDRGTHLVEGIALGVRRLSIVDVSGGHQPFTNEDDQVWAIQNGELYNHDTVRTELEADGHRFATRCDTEVLPHLYERDGAGVPAALRGKFAIAVWDARRRRLLLARDRMGVKPLYVARVRDLLVFASELKSVLASGLVEAELDREAIDAYLTFGFFTGPTTPLKAVRKLLPGHRLLVADGNVRDEPYWELPYPDGSSQATEDELAEQLRAELEEAVRLRLMSDVPVGAMLSGGLDSSLVTALMARHTSGAVKTFSVGFVEDQAGNELADARLVASTLGADHHELELSFSEQAVPLERLVWHLDEPLADLSSLGFYALSEVAAGEVTVALAGQGADELFGGYPAHRNAAIADRFGWLPGPVRRGAGRLVPMAPERYRRAASVIVEEDPAWRFLTQYTKRDASVRLAADGSGATPRPDVARRMVEARIDGHVGNAALSDTLYLYQQFGIVDDMLHYFDRTSMAHSLEVRVPFLDQNVVEFAAHVPNRFKVDSRLTRKALLRRVARGVVPDSIIEKRKVGFFSGAIDGWFSAQLRDNAARWLLEPTTAAGELFEPNEMKRLVDDALVGEKRNTQALLALLMLKVWLDDTLPRALSAERVPAGA